MIKVIRNGAGGKKNYIQFAIMAKFMKSLKWTHEFIGENEAKDRLVWRFCLTQYRDSNTWESCVKNCGPQDPADLSHHTSQTIHR